MPQLRLASYSVGVSITETTEISQIGVRRLSFKQGASDDSEETVEGAEIMMSPTDPGKVTITYNPDVRRLQTELRTEKHPLQLIVEYEVSYYNYDLSLSWYHFLASTECVIVMRLLCVCLSQYVRILRYTEGKNHKSS